MILFFCLEIFKNSYTFETNISSVTDFGRNILFLHKNITQIYFASGFPTEGNYFVPPGTTLVTQGAITENDALKWEGTISIKKHFYFFAPSIIYTPDFVKTIISEEFPHFFNPSLYNYSYLNLSILNNEKIIINFNYFTNDIDKQTTEKDFKIKSEKIEQTSPFVYRTLKGDISGYSKTFIYSSMNENIEIFEPFSSLCYPNIKQISTNCQINHVKQKQKGYTFYIQTKENENCSYSYRYRCSFPKWNQFGQNPEKGFFVGPNLITNQKGEMSYSNIAWLVLPTPDFSMIFNTPIITGFIFSSIFAIGIRHILKIIRSDE